MAEPCTERSGRVIRSPVMKMLAAFFCAITMLAAADAAGQKGFVPLFDGKDLKGWKTVSSHWVVEDGVIALKDRTDNEEHNGDYLWTEREYANFVLDLEYKTPALPGGSNSGVFLRTTDTADPVPNGIEIQIYNVKAGAPIERNSPGAIYDLVAPSKIAHRAGEWNRYSSHATTRRSR